MDTEVPVCQQAVNLHVELVSTGSKQSHGVAAAKPSEEATHVEDQELSSCSTSADSALSDSSSDHWVDRNNRSTRKDRNNTASARKGQRKKARSESVQSVDVNADAPEDEPLTFQFCTQLYKFSEHLAEYTRLYQETLPQLMCTRCKCYISTEQNGVGCLDLLFSSFCQFMGMERLKNLPSYSGERVFCWLGKRKANEVLPVLRPNHHFINRLPLDIYLKDKQSLASGLRANTFQRGLSYPAHRCPHSGGSEVAFQLLCPHQYAEHSFRSCTEPGCFQRLEQEARTERGVDRLHSGDLCPCFAARYFVPETKVFSSTVQQSVFIEELAQSAPDSQWIVKPSYMRSGKGVRVFASADHLRAFLKVQTCRRFMWGQDYVVQRYIKNPMLTNTGKKFDLRMFLLVIVGRFWRVLGFLHPGFVRKVANPYQRMGKADKFDPATHLANTRVWKRAAAAAAADSLKSPQTEQTSSSSSQMAASTMLLRQQQQQQKQQQQQQQLQQQKQPFKQQKKQQRQQQQQQQQQNSAATGRSRDKRYRKNDSHEEEPPFEPVPLTGFFLGPFDSDECEEYNYAVRHGCLKGNANNLPLMLGATRIPGDRHLGPPAATTSSAASRAPSVSARVSGGRPRPPSRQGKQPTSTSRSTESEAEQLEQFASNKDFLRCLQVMVERICLSVFDQVKEKSNCYQLFSLDICVDEAGKPWLLEVNPTIITEDVNWKSATIRQMIPSIFVESLSLANECTRKSLHFLALRTPKTHARKPNDLVFRENFLWMYSTPRRRCELFEMKSLKYSVDSLFKAQLASRGIVYQAVDYCPERNKKLASRAARQRSQFAGEQPAEAAAAAAAAAVAPCSSYRFPTPVARLPVLEEDVALSMRFARLQLDCLGRQRCARRLELASGERQVSNKLQRYAAYCRARKRTTLERPRPQFH